VDIGVPVQRDAVGRSLGTLRIAGDLDALVAEIGSVLIGR
jgi:hypothetical protein